jgi:hypothetical protein
VTERPLPATGPDPDRRPLTGTLKGSAVALRRDGRPPSLQPVAQLELNALALRVRSYLRVPNGGREATVAQECQSEFARRARPAFRP